MSFSEIVATALGVAGSVLGALIAVPQSVRVVRKGVAGVSSVTFQLLFA